MAYLIPALLIIFVASFTQGLTAFGFSLIAVPLLVLFISPRVVVPIMIIFSLLLNIYLLISCKKHLKLKRIIPLMIFGILGIPFGAWVLRALSAQTLKIIIGITISFFALLFLLGFRREVVNEKRASVPVGFISGVLNGSISMSGPPVILFFANQGTRKDEFRANLVAYFLVLNIFSIPVFILNGLITGEVLNHSAYLLPALVTGMVLGNALAAKLPEKIFRKIALVIVFLSGLLSLLAGAGVIN